MDTLIKNASIITFDEGLVVEDGYILIDSGKITGIGEGVPKDVNVSRVIDARGRIVTPGLINMHTHLYSSLARGMPIPEVNSFYEILDKIWWRLDRALDEEGIYLSAVLGIMDSIRRGVTTLFDHHSSPNFIKGSLDLIKRAANEIGVRMSLSYEVSDRNGEKPKMEGIEENLRFFESTQDNPMIKSTFGLHASFTLSDGTFELIKNLTEDLDIGFHIHLAEGPEDEEDSIKKYGMRTTQRLERWGILGKKSLVIHGVQLDESEIAILKRTNTPLIHNPSSNMNNAVGMAPLTKMINEGITLGVGTDGFGQDILGELRNSYLLMRHHLRNPNIGIEVLSFISNNIKLASEHFGYTVGKITEGASGDVVIFDYIPPTPLNGDTLFSHLLFGLVNSTPKVVMVNGKIVYEEGHFTEIDEETLLRRMREKAKEIWELM